MRNAKCEKLLQKNHLPKKNHLPIDQPTHIIYTTHAIVHITYPKFVLGCLTFESTPL